MFRNKHLIVAMLVAPVLAVAAWFAVDYFVAERPHSAREGAAYPLVAKSNCRYDSGQCDLENGEFKLSIRPVSVTAEDVQLELRSAFPLQSATIGLVVDDIPAVPISMETTDENALLWVGSIDLPTGSSSALRIAVTAQEAAWYVEVSTAFLTVTN